MTRQELILQIVQLRGVYNGLYFDDEDDTRYRIAGTLAFSASYKNETLENAYQIQLTVPKSYPLKIPVIRETGGRIPPSFHTNPDGTLCLEAPIKLYLDFNENPTLLHFINKCALPYFYSFSYMENFGQLPFGERAHGGQGLIQMYKEFFQLGDDQIIISLIKILAENAYKGSQLCPCHSGNKLYKCHGPALKKIQNLQGSKYYSLEYVQMLMYLKENNIPINNSLKSKNALKKADKLVRLNS